MSNEVQRGFDNQNSMANQRDILAAVSNNALQEMQNNATIQAIREEGAATRALYDQRYMAEQDRRIAKLEMQNAMAGVVRYPMSTAYNAGYNPFCNCGMAA